MFDNFHSRVQSAHRIQSFEPSRRSLLKFAAAGFGWTYVAEQLAMAAETAPRGATAKSVIILWMQGGASQLETFDPHPGTDVAGESKAIDTRAPGIQIDQHYPALAEEMDKVSLVRSIVSKEGDHERATYNVKTGFRPDPTLIHPSLGAIMCHQLSDQVEIPRHVSILNSPWPARGGYLGDQFDAFKIDDPVGNIPDVRPRVDEDRFLRRLDDLKAVVEPAFAKRRMVNLDGKKTLHQTAIDNARRMMTSDQLKAFNVNEAPAAVRAEFGNNRMGRGCLAAARLIEAGVRCVEVTLTGWDTHASNHEGHRTQAELLDPAYAALLKYLDERKLLEHTVVLCGSEFGRTPKINPAGGRDHWPHGFTMALSGGGIKGGRVVGATTHELPLENNKPRPEGVEDPRSVADVHATILHALGIDFKSEHRTPIGRPMTFSEGKVIQEFL